MLSIYIFLSAVTPVWSFVSASDGDFDDDLFEQGLVSSTGQPRPSKHPIGPPDVSLPFQTKKEEIIKVILFVTANTIIEVKHIFSSLLLRYTQSYDRTKQHICPPRTTSCPLYPFRCGLDIVGFCTVSWWSEGSGQARRMNSFTNKSCRSPLSLNAPIPVVFFAQP